MPNGCWPTSRGGRPLLLGPGWAARMGRQDGAIVPIRLLTFSTLYPNNARPNHGVFVENRLRHLVGSGEATSEVVAPVPWFPISHPRFGDWAVNARVAGQEIRH